MKQLAVRGIAVTRVVWYTLYYTIYISSEAAIAVRGIAVTQAVSYTLYYTIYISSKAAIAVSIVGHS